MTLSTLSTESALRASILHAPADDAPRLVYADWLEENGQGERAEFIRVQCELARLADPNDSSQPVKHVALRRRERQLLEEPRNFVNWVPLFLHRGSGVGVRYKEDTTVEITGGLVESVTFARGFISHVAAPLDVLIGGECANCAGDGYTGPHNSGHSSAGPCPDCGGEWFSGEPGYSKGTGRTTGILAALREREPVASVRTVDCEPWAITAGKAGFRWFCDDFPDAVRSLGRLSTALVRLMPQHPDYVKEDANLPLFRSYPTTDAAHAALSAALIAASKRRD